MTKHCLINESNFGGFLSNGELTNAVHVRLFHPLNSLFVTRNLLQIYQVEFDSFKN